MDSRPVVVGLLLVGIVGLAVLAGPHIPEFSEPSEHRGGMIETCVLEDVPTNATVVPASNDTVQAAAPVLRAVRNATQGNDTDGFTTYSPDEQPAVETFVDTIPSGPRLDDPCQGWFYVRYDDEVVLVAVMFYE